MLERNDEDDAPVGVLQQIGMLALIKPGDDDMAALDEAEMALRRDAGDLLRDNPGPRSRGIDEDAGPEIPARAALLIDGGDDPGRALALCGDAGGSCENDGAVRGGVARIGDDQPGIVDPAIGIGEALCGNPPSAGSPYAGRKRSTTCEPGSVALRPPRRS